MPAKSQAQLRLMYWIAKGKGKKKDGSSKEVAEEFVEETKNVKGLPEKVKKKK